MTPQIIITNTGVFDIVAGIGVPGKSILVGGGTVTGGGGGGNEEFVGIRALALKSVGLFDSSSESWSGYPDYNYMLFDPITNAEQKFTIERLPSASLFPIVGSPYDGKLDSIWSNYYNKFIVTTDAGLLTSENGKLFEPTGLITNPSSVKPMIVSNNAEQIVVALQSNDTLTIKYCSIEDATEGVGTFPIGVTTGSIFSLAYSPTLNRYVGVGRTFGSNTSPQHGLIYSDDGMDWFTGSFGFSWGSFPNIYSVLWAPTQSMFVGVGDNFKVSTNDAVYYSMDGITWYTGSAPGANNGATIARFHNILDYNGKLVALGGYTAPSYASIITSSNGINWSSVEVPNSQSYFALNSYANPTSPFILDGKYAFRVPGPFLYEPMLLTSSNGQNWGIMSNLFSPAPNSPNSISYSPSLDKYLITDLSGFGIGASVNSVSTDFITYESFDSDINAILRFETSQSSGVYNTPLQYYSIDQGYGFSTSSNSYRWVQFELYNEDTVPQYTDTYGTASYGIEISSASISNASYTDVVGLEDVEVGGKRYIQEIDDPTLLSRYAYYELDPYYELPLNFTQSYSFTVKSEGRRYVYFMYGYYGDSMLNSDYVGMKIDTIGGSITYYEDVVTNVGNVFGTDPAYGGLKFINPPSIVSSGSGYWTVSFDVGMLDTFTYTTLMPTSIQLQSGSF